MLSRALTKDGPEVEVVSEADKEGHAESVRACFQAWRREKRVALIKSANLAWDDLAADWYESVGAKSKQIPRDARDDRGEGSE